MHSATPSREYLRVASLSSHELEHMMIRGEKPDVDQLIDWMYKGRNVPLWARLVGIGKFVKGFYRGRPGTYQLEAEGDVYGYNAMVRQNAAEEPWLLKPSAQAPFRHSYYRVTDVDPEVPDNAYLHAMLLDYGQGGGPVVDPSRGIRDYLVRVEPGSDDLLLGKAYFRIGPAIVHTNFFVLERMGRA